ncbi:MAG: glycosyltransferase [Candidatus Ratteibacteria bacterium]|nr:glycosyltransferase [Candidatus Ratteibacteria bacterium]
MENIKFSVIVAVAPERTPEVIKWLKNQDYPEGKYEIIVKRGPNTSQNRNDGVKEAKGKYIAFVDDDAIVERNWLKKAEEFFEAHPDIDVVGGPQLTPPDDTAFGFASGIVFASILGGASIRHRYKRYKLNLNSDERELTSANLFCKRNVFEKEMFDPAFWPGEDPVFFSELIGKGIKLAYYPELYIYHRRRSSPAGLFKQVFYYGYVRPKIKSTKKTGVTSFLFGIPSLFVIYLVLLPLLLVWNKIFLLPILIYLFLIFLFACVISVKEKRGEYLLLIPVTFFIIHIGYGTGFLCGSVNRLLSMKKNRRSKNVKKT